MVNIVGNIDGISIFEDSLIEDNKIIKGRKQGGAMFIIANPKTSQLIYKSFLTKLRKDKLDSLNNL